MTAQIREKITFNGVTYGMCNEPLRDYFEIARIKSPVRGFSTANWRGYVGHWEILKNRLYLTELYGGFGVDDFQISSLFPGYDMVFAHWYSGELRLNVGEMIGYVHAGFASQYEKDIFITVNQGVVLETQIQNNKTGVRLTLINDE